MSAFFEGGGSLLAQILDGRMRRSPTTPTTVDVVSKYPQCIVWFVTKHACDGRTDRQNYGITKYSASIDDRAVKW